MTELLKYDTALSTPTESIICRYYSLCSLDLSSSPSFLCPPPLPSFAADAYDNDAVLKKPSLASVKRKESKLRRAKVRLTYTYLPRPLSNTLPNHPTMLNAKVRAEGTYLRKGERGEGGDGPLAGADADADADGGHVDDDGEGDDDDDGDDGEGEGGGGEGMDVEAPPGASDAAGAQAQGRGPGQGRS